MSSWLILFVAGLFEICWTIGLKYSEGFSNLKWSVFTVITLSLSMFLLGLSLKALPIGTAYAVWTGIGIIGSAILGMLLFNEPKEFMRFFFIGLIVAGIVGLRVMAK